MHPAHSRLLLPPSPPPITFTGARRRRSGWLLGERGRCCVGLATGSLPAMASGVYRWRSLTLRPPPPIPCFLAGSRRGPNSPACAPRSFVNLRCDLSPRWSPPADCLPSGCSHRCSNRVQQRYRRSADHHSRRRFGCCWRLLYGGGGSWCASGRESLCPCSD